MELKPAYLEHGFRVLSPSPSQGEGRGEGIIPEILDHAQDVAEALGLERNYIVELKLAGNKDEALYRELLPIYWLFSSGKQKLLKDWYICIVIMTAPYPECVPNTSRRY